MRTTSAAKTRFVSILAIVAWMPSTGAEGASAVDVTLVRGGEACSTIVVATEPTPAARLAALELQYHIRKITGAVVPVRTDRETVEGTRILVGESEATAALGIEGDKIQPLEYVIRFRPDTLIQGKKPFHQPATSFDDIREHERARAVAVFAKLGT